MIKFSKNLLNLVLLISLIFSFCSNDIFEETTDFNEENEDFTFEDTTIEDTTIDDFETSPETDEIFKETSEQDSTSSIKITTQESTREGINATTVDATTNALTNATTFDATTNALTNATIAKSTAQETSSVDSSSESNRGTSDSVALTTQAVGTSSLSIQWSQLIVETTSIRATLQAEESPESSFNTRIQMNGIVRNRRIRTEKRVVVQLERILFIEDVNVTNIEQALLKSIGFESFFNVTNEGNDEYSIGFTTDINTSVNSELTLDEIILKIVQNLKRDEGIIQAEANKVGFDLSVDTSKTVIYATETLVINGIPYIIICEKTLDQTQMSCQQGTLENGTITIELTSEVDLESFAYSPNISRFLLILVTSTLSFQIIH